MNIRRLVLISILAGIVVIAQVSISFIPNVELVTFLLIVFTLTLGYKDTILISIIFIILDGTFWGFHTWVIGYFFIFPLYITITHLLRKFLLKKVDYIAYLSFIFGITFGFWFSILHGFLYGFNYFLGYFVAGIGFDIIHGFANYIIVLLVFDRVYKFINKMLLKLNFKGD